MDMRSFFTVALILTGQLAWADGFAITNLNNVKLDTSQFEGGTYESLVEKDQIIVACETCDDLSSVHLEMGRSTDGTEGRFRSGETTIEKMRGICQERDPKCKLTRLDVGNAVGWITEYTLGATKGSTAVLFQDGDLLTIRVLSDSRQRVERNMSVTLRYLAPQIVEGK